MQIKTRSDLRALGWSQEALKAILAPKLLGRKESEKRVLYRQAAIFASPLFQELWYYEIKQASAKKCQGLVKLAMTVVGMPADLEGQESQAVFFLSRMADLAPHHPFWKEFSIGVRRAFPGDSFLRPESEGLLKRQLHQFRYVISCQQAQWVRDHFKKEGMTDSKALAAYLDELGQEIEINIGSSARLHNKVYIDNEGGQYYPDDRPTANFKVLLDFHTEFILSDRGDFLNELDAERMSQAGVVNGASFNYGYYDSQDNNYAHSRYDIKPTGLYEPPYRERVIANKKRRFKAPSYDRSERGYLAKRGLYAREGHSAKWHVDQAVWDFESLLKKKRLRRFFRGLIRPIRGLFY